MVRALRLAELAYWYYATVPVALVVPVPVGYNHMPPVRIDC